MRLPLSLALFALMLSACEPVPDLFGPTSIPPTLSGSALTSDPQSIPIEPPAIVNTQAGDLAKSAPAPATTTADAMWISPAVPATLAAQAQAAGAALMTDRDSATYSLEVSDGEGAVWIYALVAPFPTVTDDVTLDDLRNAWSGSPSGPFASRPLRMAESTREAFRALWGEPASGSVLTVPAQQLLDEAWANRPAWAIIPFEEIQPRWKVLSVDGQSPIRKDFDPSAYPLKINFALHSNNAQPFDGAQGRRSTFNVPNTNRDSSKLTTVIMTGVTALVRATAKTMDVKGITYPGEAYRDIFREADILHINNEVPFYGGCPDPDPSQYGMVFCSATRYIKLLTDIGTDVIELSGDHFANYGVDGMNETLVIYKEANIKIYGGGANIYEGRAPLLLEVNGNRIMFIGCNIKSIYATATETRPGAVPCDFPYMTTQIAKYRAEGYLPIATFQYHEYSSPETRPEQQQDFRRQADAGALIVSGSQAHLPQGMEFYNESFIHYGLGNLFFDQMGKGVNPNRYEFIDRHVFYDGKYLGVELLTAMLEDFSRPRPMTLEERFKMLTDYFSISGW